MARASAALGRIEGEGYGYDAAADVDYGLGPVETSAGGHASVGARFANDAVGRRTLILWGASAVWLLLVWRAVEGY